MNFYNFTQCVTLQKKKKEDDFLPTGCIQRLGALIKHHLIPGHPLTETHHLVQHTDKALGQNGKQYVPRVIGSNIPREHTGEQWMLFTLAHFRPLIVHTL